MNFGLGNYFSVLLFAQNLISSLQNLHGNRKILFKEKGAGCLLEWIKMEDWFNRIQKVIGKNESKSSIKVE